MILTSLSKVVSNQVLLQVWLDAVGVEEALKARAVSSGHSGSLSETPLSPRQLDEACPRARLLDELLGLGGGGFTDKRLTE
jgi:hypothetical protein